MIQIRRTLILSIDFNESGNRALDQTKDNINRSIQESKNQIPQYNNIVNSYQEQTLQDVKEKYQRTILNLKKPLSNHFNQHGVLINRISIIKLIPACLMKQLPMRTADL